MAKENLGTTAGLTAAAALLVDYVLTVSVSVAAGVEAFTSAAQGTDFAWLAGHRAMLCLGMIAIVVLANLRGIRESGGIFAVPTYLFLFSFLGMIVWGLGYFALNPDAVAFPATAAILVLAANTSFADFPRLASLMARDRFMPQQFTNVGDRLVFSNGILLLAFFSALLTWVFKGDTSRLIPLLPEFVTTHWWQQFLHNQPIFLLKTALLYRTGIVVSSVPYQLG